MFEAHHHHIIPLKYCLDDLISLLLFDLNQETPYKIRPTTAVQGISQELHPTIMDTSRLYYLSERVTHVSLLQYKLE